MNMVKVTYRGWPAHFICGDRCVFHLNTLLEYNKTKIVVSTVGLMKDPEEVRKVLKQPDNEPYSEIGLNRYFETMAFHAEKRREFWDADVSKEISFDSQWAWSKPEDEWKANKGHLKIVQEISDKILKGQLK